MNWNDGNWKVVDRWNNYKVTKWSDENEIFAKSIFNELKVFGMTFLIKINEWSTVLIVIRKETELEQWCMEMNCETVTFSLIDDVARQTTTSINYFSN